MEQRNCGQEINTPYNSTYPKVAVQWLNQALCFYQSFCLVDSEVLRNRHLRVAANRSPNQMIKVLFILLLTVCLSYGALGQTIQEIFKALPLSYTLELSNETKNLLMEEGNCTMPNGDSLETMSVDYLTEKDYIKLQYYFTTGQSGFIVIELKKFQKIDGAPIVVYSKFGGTPSAYEQHSLVTFDYKNGTLLANKNLGLPETLETAAFLKDNLPDSLKEEKISISTNYNLNPKNQIKWNMK